tara:strand:+ start:4873 stop:5196 length:324 start_codon:yes stop_codon:yes gene_type:complete
MNKIFITFIAALIIGIITLLTIKWINFYKDIENIKIPPWQNNCPDYWLMEGKGQCRNIHRIGKCALEGDGVVDFGVKPFVGEEGEKNKCRISKVCNIPWTGIDDKCI